MKLKQSHLSKITDAILLLESLEKIATSESNRLHISKLRQNLDEIHDMLKIAYYQRSFSFMLSG